MLQKYCKSLCYKKVWVSRSHFSARLLLYGNGKVEGRIKIRTASNFPNIFHRCYFTTNQHLVIVANSIDTCPLCALMWRVKFKSHLFSIWIYFIVWFSEIYAGTSNVLRFFLFNHKEIRIKIQQQSTLFRISIIWFYLWI